MIIIFVLFLTGSVLIPPALSGSTTSQLIQTQGQILYASSLAQLHASGSYLYDSLGNLVRLKSMQVTWNERMKVQGSGDMATNPSNTWFSLADVQRLKNAGANCLEIHMMWLTELMPTKDVPNTSFFSTWVDVWVDWCTQNQIYCILNVRPWGFGGAHYTDPSWLWQGIYSEPTTDAEWSVIIRDFFDTDVSAQNSNRAAIVDLWKFIANRYLNNPYVLFGIFNEPLCGVTIPDRATCQHLAATYSTFMGNVVDGIRSAGSNSLVFIDRPYITWYTYGDIQPVNKDNIVWEDHVYMETLPDHGWSYFTGWVDTFVNRICGVFGKPLFIGEYGFDPVLVVRSDYSSTWQQYLIDMKTYIDSKTTVGRQFHCWDYMYGEYSALEGQSDFSSSESSYVIQTVLQ